MKYESSCNDLVAFLLKDRLYASVQFHWMNTTPFIRKMNEIWKDFFCQEIWKDNDVNNVNFLVLYSFVIKILFMAYYGACRSNLGVVGSNNKGGSYQASLMAQQSQTKSKKTKIKNVCKWVH